MSDKINHDIVTCDRWACHGNKKGICRVLVHPITDKPCPFYKNSLRLAMELEALSERPIDWVAYRRAQHIK